MKGKVVKENHITEGSIFGQPLLLSFPISFGTSFQQLHSMADVMVAGRFMEKQALAVMDGNTDTLINLLVGFSAGLSNGVTVVISQFYSARKADKVHWTVHISIIFSAIGGIIFITVGLVGLPQTLEATKIPENIMGYAVVYIRIYFLGIIVSLVYDMGAGILRAVGDSRRPLYFSVASRFTNIILDASLVAALRMGVAGATPATITSQLLNAVLVVHVLMKTDDMYKLEWKKVRINQRMPRRIARIDIFAGVRSAMYNTLDVVIQASVGTPGAGSVTVWATCGKVDGLYWMIVNTLGISATTFVEQNFGAGHLDRVCKGAGACMVIGVMLTASVGVVLYDGGHLLAGLSATDLQVQAIGMDLLRLMVLTFITYIAIEILPDTLKGAEDMWMPLVAMSIGVCAVRVLWITLILFHYHTIIRAAFCYPLTRNLTTATLVIHYYSFSSLRRWKPKPLKKRFGVYKPF